MEYVEMLRVRRIVSWFGGVIFVLLAIGLIVTYSNGGPHVQMSHDQDPRIPVYEVFAVCGLVPLIIVAVLATGLDAEYKTVAIAWTRPAARLAIALRYVAVDATAYVVAWAIVIVATFIPMFALGLNRYFVYEEHIAGFLALGAGVAVMWYGLVMLISALAPGRGGAVVGASWAYALIVPGISQIPFPPAIHTIVRLLNYLDPLAYFGNLGSGKNPLIVGTTTEHTIAAWLIGLIAVGAGTYIWSIREVPA